MRSISLGFFLGVLLATMFAGSISAAEGPPNSCLMIPEVQQGHRGTPNDYQPDSCIT